MILAGCASAPPVQYHSAGAFDAAHFKAAKVECVGETDAALAGRSLSLWNKQQIIDEIFDGCMARKGYVR